MPPRLDDTKASPGAVRARFGPEVDLHGCGLGHGRLHPVKLRASQVNGCAYGEARARPRLLPHPESHQHEHAIPGRPGRGRRAAPVERIGRASVPGGAGPRDGIAPGGAASELTSYLASVGHGLTVRAIDGASREELNRIVDPALAFWPDAPAGRPTVSEAGPRAGGGRRADPRGGGGTPRTLTPQESPAAEVER